MYDRRFAPIITYSVVKSLDFSKHLPIKYLPNILYLILFNILPKVLLYICSKKLYLPFSNFSHCSNFFQWLFRHPLAPEISHLNRKWTTCKNTFLCNNFIFQKSQQIIPKHKMFQNPHDAKDVKFSSFWGLIKSKMPSMKLFFATFRAIFIVFKIPKSP